MKILTTLVSHSANNNKLNACLKTWIPKIQKPHDYIIAGDIYQSKEFDKCVNCSSIKGEGRHFLTYKTYEIIKNIIDLDFDFWHKCDDDVYVDYDNLTKFIEQFDPLIPNYIGSTIVNPFAYNLGFSYLINKSLLKLVLSKIEQDIDICNKDIAEDRTIGKIISELGIKPQHYHQFHCENPKFFNYQTYSNICAGLINKSIIASVLHYNAENYIYSIHNELQRIK